MANPIPTLPRQAWAHRDGMVDMRPLAPADWSPAALAARAQVAEAFARFAVALDEARLDALVTCFTEEATFEVAEGNGEPFVRFAGRAELFDRLTQVLAQQGDQRRHLIGNVLVEQLDLDAGTASALAFGIVTRAADGLSLAASVIYAADLRREADGCWRFTYFFVGMDSYAGVKPTVGE